MPTGAEADLLIGSGFVRIWLPVRSCRFKRDPRFVASRRRACSGTVSRSHTEKSKQDIINSVWMKRTLGDSDNLRIVFV